MFFNYTSLINKIMGSLSLGSGFAWRVSSTIFSLSCRSSIAIFSHCSHHANRLSPCRYEQEEAALCV